MVNRGSASALASQCSLSPPCCPQPGVHAHVVLNVKADEMRSRRRLKGLVPLGSSPDGKNCVVVSVHLMRYLVSYIKVQHQQAGARAQAVGCGCPL